MSAQKLAGLGRLAFVLVVAGTSACYHGIDLSTDDGGADGETEEGVAAEELPSPNTRFFRLTHRQWENSVQELFYLAQPSGLSEAFRADPYESGYLFDNNGQALDVDEALWAGYRSAAVQMADRAMADSVIREAIFPIDTGDDAAMGAAFIRDFGLRAFRRPLTDIEVADYSALFAQGSQLYVDLDAFEAGIRVVVESMLQSPFFLYRIETSSESDGRVVPLNSFEVASRLSFAFWDSMPDEGLFDAALADGLRDAQAVRNEALRMLDDPRALAVAEGFHDRLFTSAKFLSAEPSPGVFPNAPDDLGELALEEFHHFVNEIVFASGGGVEALLTSSETFVNADLAEIYGLPDALGNEFERVQLPAGQRRGILTQIGFLAGNATGVNPDPIHRGKFILERITCTDIPPPPDMVPGLPVVQGQTNRQAIEALTEQSGTVCVSCHGPLINPFGFPFENYDSTGAFRVLDNGLAVDPATTILLDGARVEVENAFELIDALARSPAVHACYAKHWVEYVSGRPAVAGDDPLIARLGTVSLDEQMSLKELLVELAASEAFRSRSVQEL